MPLPVFDNAAYEALLASRRQNDHQVLNQQGGIYNAQMGALGLDASLIDARRRANQARLSTIGAGTWVTAAQRGVNAAQAGVLGAETMQLAGTRGVIGLQQQQAAARQADVSLIRGARDNVADKVAVGQAGLAQGVEDQRLYGRLGVAAPVSVDVPVGQSGGTLGLGTRASLRTQEDIVRGQAADHEADRAATLENAKLALSMSATNVTEAELMARRAGLSLADARIMVDEAQTREAMAGVDVGNAQLDTSQRDLELQRLGINLNQTKLIGQADQLGINDMKAPGDQGFQLYTDPYTRQRSWKTPAEADQLQHDYEVGLTRQRLPESIQLQQERALALQQQQVAQNPFYGFDDSDFVWFLAQSTVQAPVNAGDIPYPGGQQAVAKAASAHAITQVAAALRSKFPGASEAVINTKLLQYIRTAQVLQAKLADEEAAKAEEQKAKDASAAAAAKRAAERRAAGEAAR